MPKSFTNDEREYINNKLKNEAKKCLNLYGVKKTTVDEIVKRVNIPKGTFYLFYESKELLLFEVINAMHDEIQKQLIIDISLIKDKISCENLTELLFDIYKKVDSTCLLNIMINGELELLMRKLPNGVVEEHLKNDNEIMEKLAALIPNFKKAMINVYSGALRAIFLSMLHKREVGEEIFDESLRLMLNGLVMQLLEDNHDWSM